MNDIVVFNYLFEKHLRYFNQIFSFFVKLNIVLKSFKIYFNYSIILLFNQKIDRFDLLTTQKKLIVILKFRFSRTLKNFEIYLNMID